ncbi:MAG: C-GCAxxG-C-C family protein [Myxococcota bacterium]|nr:C-GCAxxG-C-C family protein [Myxococcota bacterium]
MSDTPAQKAEALFQEGFSCAQSVVQAFCERFGVPRETAARMSTAFGAGICGRAGMCGVASGALMVIGLAHGRVIATDTAARDKTYALSNEFLARFETLAHGLDCRDILGVDISTAAGKEDARASGVFEHTCPSLVGQGSRLLEELLGRA